MTRDKFLVIITVCGLLLAAAFTLLGVRMENDKDKMLKKAWRVPKKAASYLCYEDALKTRTARQIEEARFLDKIRKRFADSKRVYLLHRQDIDAAYYEKYLFPIYEKGTEEILCESEWMSKNNIYDLETPQGQEMLGTWYAFMSDFRNGINEDKNPKFIVVNLIKNWEELFPDERKQW